MTSSPQRQAATWLSELQLFPPLGCAKALLDISLQRPVRGVEGPALEDKVPLPFNSSARKDVSNSTSTPKTNFCLCFTPAVPLSVVARQT